MQNSRIEQRIKTLQNKIRVVEEKSFFEEEVTKDSDEIELYEESKKVILQLDLVKKIQMYMSTNNPEIVATVSSKHPLTF